MMMSASLIKVLTLVYTWQAQNPHFFPTFPYSWKCHDETKTMLSRILLWGGQGRHSHSLPHRILHMRDLKLRKSKFLKITYWSAEDPESQTGEWGKGAICQQILIKYFAFKSARTTKLFMSSFFPQAPWFVFLWIILICFYSIKACPLSVINLVQSDFYFSPWIQVWVSFHGSFFLLFFYVVNPKVLSIFLPFELACTWEKAEEQK